MGIDAEFNLTSEITITGEVEQFNEKWWAVHGKVPWQVQRLQSYGKTRDEAVMRFEEIVFNSAKHDLKVPLVSTIRIMFKDKPKKETTALKPKDCPRCLGTGFLLIYDVVLGRNIHMACGCTWLDL